MLPTKIYTEAAKKRPLLPALEFYDFFLEAAPLFLKDLYVTK